MNKNSNRNRKILFLTSFLFLFSFFLISFISAQPPFQSAGDLMVGYPKIDVVQQNVNHTFRVHIFNSTSFISNVSGQCGITFMNPDGVVAFKNQNIPYVFGSENEWEIVLDKGNFSLLGQHSLAIECNTSSQAGFASLPIEVTPSGTTNTTTFLFVFLVIIALVYMLGIKTESNWVMFFAGFLTLLFGFWVLINGVDIIKDVTTTRAIGFIIWGLAIIVMFKSAEGQLAEGFGK